MCCDEKSGCQIQEKLKGKPQECNPDQIKECHGKKTEHPCIDSKKKE
jgi:hypothetical protein